MNSSINTQLAAIDLGSNSFHLTIAREVQGELQLLDRLAEKVQLAAGLNHCSEISDEAVERGLNCLRMFAQRLQGVEKKLIRVVGTNTLRVARNRQQFIQCAETILGCPVEVISGREEARLIYLGVAHSFSDDQEQRLVVDIGGGSTEFILGKHFSPLQLESLQMGCISYSQRFFPLGLLTKEAFAMATNSAHRELLNIGYRYRKAGWTEVVGSSGTIKAAYQLLSADESTHQPITLRALIQFREQLIEVGHIHGIHREGLKDKRAAVLPAGIAILIAVFEALNIESMSYSDGALREGLLYDHIGRLQHEDVRERSVIALMERYHTDLEQGDAVERTALNCLCQINLNTDENCDLISWAARLHEIGLSISHSQFQKHGAYLVQHSELMGFNQSDQAMLALLIRGHRRKLPVAELELMPADRRQDLLTLMILLRLAVLLHRSRQAQSVPCFEFSFGNDRLITIVFPDNWLNQHPLTRADLEQEANYLQSVNIDISVR